MRLVWLAGLTLMAPLALSAQTFRADVQLVNVGFSVRDSSGRLVENLSQDDFEVFEDGVPQKISFFARSADVPLNLGLIVDISGSQASFVNAHLKDLRVFLERALAPRDRAFLVCFSNQPRLVTEFTSSPKSLVAALDGYQHVRDRTLFPMLGPFEIRTGGTAFYDAIYHSANQMLGPVESGRKALIVFSDGEDNSSAHHLLDSIEIAQTVNVLLFGIRYTEVHNERWTARNKYGASVMERLGRETGGADFDASEKGLAAHFNEIGNQLRLSYELAYHSTNPPSDGTFHKLAIRPRTSGLSVRSKTGYFARTR